MRLIANRLVMAAVVSSLIMMWNEHNGRSVAAAQQRAPAALTRIYTGSDGQTHLQQVDLKLNLDPLLGREQSETVKVTNSYVVRFPPGYMQDWHPAQARRYVITLSGRGEIELAGGQKISLEPGGILQAEDVTGKGHITRTLGKVDWTALFVQLDQ
jgi:quercetin dioxygenase-like cupin family protein